MVPQPLQSWRGLLRGWENVVKSLRRLYMEPHHWWLVSTIWVITFIIHFSRYICIWYMLFSGISLCPPYVYVGTGKSRFKKLHFSLLKSSHVWFKKDLYNDSKKLSSKKISYGGDLQFEIFLKSGALNMYISTVRLFSFGIFICFMTGLVINLFSKPDNRN